MTGEKERIFLVVINYELTRGWQIDELAREMEELVLACDGNVVETLVCRLEKPTAAYFLGSGKVQELAALGAQLQVDTVVFSHDLKGSQQRNLEEILKVKTIDRTQLILDIFARHATSQEGKMQVELAQLEYLLPRLVGQGIALSRLGGGIGTLGPGETKLEMDRRRIGERIAKLKKDLKEVSSNRAVKRKKRQDQDLPLISLVGYTNAGKSTLLNRLTGAEQLIRDGLFTTLDSLSRQCILPNRQKVILSDTVGFMHNLPHNLIESFKATLEEVIFADMLLLVLDVSDVHFRNRHNAVLEVLKDLGADQKLMITVLNKIDLIEDRAWLSELKSICQYPVAVSAKTGEQEEELLKTIQRLLGNFVTDVEVTLPISRMDLVHRAYSEGQVSAVKYYNDVIYLRASVPSKTASFYFNGQISQ
ncbi:MAG: GTPase HflX [Candidatus Omnitrophota bacterium]|jgi:GTP-binding protein HflX